MLVSNFEVAATADPQTRSETRYALQVTNLADVAIEFLVRVDVTPPLAHGGGARAARALVGVWAGATGSSLEFRSTPTTVRGRSRVGIPPHASATFTLRKITQDEEEYRGYVDLSVPLRRPEGRWELPSPQSDAPVPVLLHARRVDWRPQRRVGVRDHDGLVPYYTSTSDDYSSESIALATGAARVELDPGRSPLLESDQVRHVLAGLESGALEADEVRGALDLSPEDRVAAVFDLLGGLADLDDDVDAVNEHLADLGIALRLRRP
jgi:hypothetical protein